MKSSFPILSLFLVSAAGAISASAAVLVDLRFDSLPSVQGFTYSASGPHAGELESSNFALINGTTLQQTTVENGMGANSPGNSSFLQTYDEGVTGSETNFRLEVTGSVSMHEQTRQDFSYAAFTYNAYVGGKGVFFGIKPNELHVNGSYFSFAGFDGSVDQAYVIDVDLGNDTFELFVDGVSRQTGSIATTTAGFENSLTFGDGTGTANANGQISRLRVTSNIPEPSTAFLVLIGAVGLIHRRR